MRCSTVSPWRRGSATATRPSRASDSTWSARTRHRCRRRPAARVAIRGARGHLRPGGRLVFTIFAFLGPKTALAKVEAAGLAPTIVASELQSFPRIAYERLEHIRSVDAEATVPAGVPETVERFVIQGIVPR